MTNLFEDGFGNFSAVTVFAVAGVFVMLAAFSFSVLRVLENLRKNISVSYRIALLGLPRSGKTALISAIFSEIFASRASREFSPAGPETINRINKQIAMLDSGRVIPPTMESDVFIFRFLYYIKRILFFGRIRYEGEVVDFPGELSEKLLESALDGDLSDDIGIFHKEFYSWLISSKVSLFVVDSGMYLSSSDRRAFVARMSSEIRAAWQSLNEEISHYMNDRERRVALVFTKIDAARAYKADQNDDVTRALAYEMAFNNPLNKSEIALEDWINIADSTCDSILNDFSELVGYFKARPGKFDTFFVSSYLKTNGHRIGLPRLISFMLPNRSL